MLNLELPPTQGHGLKKYCYSANIVILFGPVSQSESNGLAR